MRITTQEFLAEVLDEVLGHVPDGAYSIEVELPTTVPAEDVTVDTPKIIEVNGKRVELYRGPVAENWDLLRIDWFTGAGASRRGSAELHVPSPYRVKKSGWGAYRAARRGGMEVREAEGASSMEGYLDPTEAETYRGLLLDGTPWRRSLELTRNLLDSTTIPQVHW